MRGADVCDERAVWFRDVAEVGYLAGVVRAHFENEEVGVFRAVEDGDRKPDVVVEVPIGRVDLAHGREERLDEFLRRGLAGRTRDGDDLGLERAAVLPRHAVEIVIAVDDSGRTLLKRLRNVVVTICLLALQRDKEHPRLHLARIKRRPGEQNLFPSSHFEDSLPPGTTQLMLLLHGLKMAFATACTSAAVTAFISATCSSGDIRRPNESIVCP